MADLRGRCHSLPLFLLAALVLCRDAAAQAKSLPQIRIHTALGDIIAVVDTVRAPVTSANFLGYVDAGVYANGRFHRTVTPQNQPDNLVKIEVIQGGRDSAHAGERAPIPLERTSVTKLKHLDGTVSMARGGPDTATSDFFICIGDQPALDFGGKRNPDGQGFAAFGAVTSGMDVVRRIQQSPAQGQTLTPAIVILSIRRVR
jgi:peptidyl-prolyl cis-trans isomerase A (cyclophilin A)